MWWIRLGTHPEAHPAAPSLSLLSGTGNIAARKLYTWLLLLKFGGMILITGLRLLIATGCSEGTGGKEGWRLYRIH